ncbi:MAG: FAD-dependent oxidoreductase [Gammaproteobacteria bacterium]|nr:MAG: FAD-dependent oxidoreductase [Gammaproteobacteria bacterium]
MKIAIIGTGISGNVLAYQLHKEHDITVFEANDYIGGHTHTHDIELQGRQYAIDTGFIVFNYKTYPQFTRLLDELGVAVQKSRMSFSVKCELTGLEYNGNNLNSLFAQRSNLFRPAFYRMINDILRFNRESPVLLETADTSTSLGGYLRSQHYSQQFIDQYIIPMGSAIWSASYQQMMKFPASFFIRFFHNHGLLSVNQRPDWYTISGGSRSYVEKLTAGFSDRIRLNTPVTSVKRLPTHVEISSAHMQAEKFDYVFFACHSDQALNLLVQPEPYEHNILSAFPYQRNEAILHTDTRMLPKRKLAWAAWNYHRLATQYNPVAVTYNMNMLQNITAPETFCVTLNNTQAIDDSRILKRLYYDHPQFTREGIEAQKQHSRLNGMNRCFYAGAYWRYGFHEDGVVSALDSLADFKEHVSYAQQAIRRAG